MNYLAHLLLSGDEEDLMIGNFVADFIKNKDLPHFTEGVQKGIFLHRAIDAFTDSHEIVKQSTKRLHPFHHKYAPVIVDVYYDFLLAKNWDKMTPSVNLDIFVKNMYKVLIIRQKELPPTLQTVLPRMIADDFLMKPTTFDGLEQVFKRIKKAAAFPNQFENAAAHLKDYLAEFDSEFCQFFPDLQTYCLNSEYVRDSIPQNVKKG